MKALKTLAVVSMQTTGVLFLLFLLMALAFVASLWLQPVLFPTSATPRCTEVDRTTANPDLYAPQTSGTQLEIVWETCRVQK